LELYSRDRNPGSALLRLWGNRGQTVKDFLTHLHNLAKIHGHCMDIPQLILRRKFVPLIWSRAQQIIVTPFGQKSDLLKLVCHAKSFPHPHFQWLDDGREIDNETTDTLIIPRSVTYKSIVHPESRL
uniref:Ig-like domain-containing protein n=1 Tax=Anisakis simplex TaxID=6269 RepID=A0A0M3JBU1_ANISI